jgi:hypothetical protein
MARRSHQVELGLAINAPMVSGMWRFLGMAKGGEPVLWVRVGRYCPDEYDTRCLQKYIAFFLRHSELQMRASPVHYVVCDMKGFKMHWMGSQMGHIQAFIEVAQNHYPERAKAIVVVNAPWLFRATFCVIRGLLDPVTADKVVVLEKEEIPAYFANILDQETLIERFGGKRPNESVPVPNIPGLESVAEFSAAVLEAKGLTP